MISAWLMSPDDAEEVEGDGEGEGVEGERRWDIICCSSAKMSWRVLATKVESKVEEAEEAGL